MSRGAMVVISPLEFVVATPQAHGTDWEAGIGEQATLELESVTDDGVEPQDLSGTCDCPGGEVDLGCLGMDLEAVPR